MPSTRRNITMLALASMLLAGNASAGGSGFQALASDNLWPRWQTRLLASPSFSLWQHAANWQQAGRRSHESISLLGDFFFSSPLQRNQAAEGFRATSGLIIGPLGSHVLSAFGAGTSLSLGVGASIARTGFVETRPHTAALDTAPYMGFGYSSGSAKAGWGFSADIGVAARNASSAGSFGRVLNGSQSMDELLREMRLSPLLNVGVTYSF